VEVGATATFTETSTSTSLLSVSDEHPKVRINSINKRNSFLLMIQQP